MIKKKKKHFVGGAVNKGISGATQGLGLNQGAGDYLGNVGQLATGAATGNPQDIMGGATGLLTGGWGTAIDTFGNKDASVGQKALAAYGAINPMASIFSSGITDKLASEKADNTEFNSMIKNRMANGGVPRQAYNEFQEYSNQPMQPMVSRQGNIPVQQPDFNYTPYRQDVSMNPMMSNNNLLEVPGMNTPEADLRARGLRENLYNNTMTNEYDGAPRSIPRGQRINPELVMNANKEDARNLAIKEYLDNSQWTQQKTQGDLQSIMTDPGFGQIQKLPSQKRDGGPIVEFNGNSHENGGIAITQGDEVEGGETMDRNTQYIHSDDKSMALPKEMLVGTGLPDNYAGKTPAAAIKLAKKELEERPDDKVAQDTFDLYNQAITNINETLRINKEQLESSQFKYGGVKKYANGGEKGNTYKINPETGRYELAPEGSPSTEYSQPMKAARDLAISDMIKNGVDYTEAYQLVESAMSMGFDPDKVLTQQFDGMDSQQIMESLQAERGITSSPTTVPTQQAQAATQQAPQGSQSMNYYNIEEATKSMSPEEKQSYVQNLAQTKNPFTGIGQEGYSLGNEGVAWQQKTGDGLYGGVSPEMINQTTNPYFLNTTFGGEQDTYSPDDLARLQRTVENDPEASKYIVNSGDRKFGTDWLTASTAGQDFSGAPGMQTRTTELESNMDAQLAPIPEKQYPGDNPPPPGDNPRDMSWLRFAPMANALIPPPDLEQYNPATISSGYLKPEMVDEQTMRANMDSAQRGNVGALSNVSGGSGAAQRAGLIGSGANYAGAVGNAFTQANQANNQATQQANQFNISNQANIAGINQQALNQAGLFNTQNQNRWNEEKRKLWSEGLESLGNIGQEEWAKKMYDKSSLMTTGATGTQGFVPTQSKYGGVKTKIGRKGLTSEFL